MSVVPLHRAPVATTREQALATGALVDLSDEAARIGFKHPVAITSEVWEDCCYWDEYIESTKYGQSTQEIEGRIRDLLCNALYAAKRSRRSATYFTYHRVPVTSNFSGSKPVTLSMSIAAGDDGKPVITIEVPRA